MLTRVPLRVTLHNDEDAVVFLEGPGVADDKTLRPTVEVTGPEGNDIAVVAYRTELLYDVPGNLGHTGRAIASFDVAVNGVYTVAVNAPSRTNIAVGHGIDVGTLARFVAALVLPGIAVLLALVIALVVAITRSQSKPPAKVSPPLPRVHAGV